MYFFLVDSFFAYSFQHDIFNIHLLISLFRCEVRSFYLSTYNFSRVFHMWRIGSGGQASTLLSPNSCYNQLCYNEIAVCLQFAGYLFALHICDEYIIRQKIYFEFLRDKILYIYDVYSRLKIFAYNITAHTALLHRTRPILFWLHRVKLLLLQDVKLSTFIFYF